MRSPLPAGRRERWLSWLVPEERNLYEGLATTPLREAYLATRALCRATLSYYTGIRPSRWRFGVASNGKPTIAQPVRYARLRFNVAHTDGLIVCIVTRRGEAGVDAEKISPAVDDRLVARHFLSKRQQRELETLPPQQRIERFFQQWVLKEAYVKASGRGLAGTPERLSIKQDARGEPLPIGNWRFTLWNPTHKHVAAAAVLLQDHAAPASFTWLRLKAGPEVMESF